MRRTNASGENDHDQTGGEDGNSFPGGDLRMREPAHETSAERKVGGQPAVQPPERKRRGRENRIEQCRCESECQEGCDDRFRQSVPEHGIHGYRAKLEPEDRSRHDSASGGNRECCCESAWQRVTLQTPLDSRNGDEDRGDGRERQLKARLEQGIRRRRHQHSCSHKERVPTVGGPRSKPCQRCKRSGDSRPYD